MPDDTLARPERWARFRFAVIGGLLASPPAGGDLQAALRALAERAYQHPCRPGERVQRPARETRSGREGPGAIGRPQITAPRADDTRRDGRAARAVL